MKKRKCALCGGKLNENGICAECGYDNSATLKNSRKSSTGINPGYVILIVSAVIFTLISIGIIRTNLQTGFEYSYVLGPGIHHVGSDIPAGKYHIRIDSGESGHMEITRFDGDVFYGVAAYEFLAKHNRERNSHFLEKDCYIVIAPNCQLGFYTDSDNKPDAEVVETGYTEEYTVPRFATEGRDFPTGVYDIVYTPEEAGGDIVVKCTSPNPLSDIQEELMSCEIRFAAKNGKQIFTGVPLTAGAKITLGRDGAQITLRPVKQTSQDFYDITWGYNRE